MQLVIHRSEVMTAKLSLMYSVEVMKTNVFQNHPSSPLFSVTVLEMEHFQLEQNH